MKKFLAALKSTFDGRDMLFAIGLGLLTGGIGHFSLAGAAVADAIVLLFVAIRR